jgi:hypothetical protein
MRHAPLLLLTLAPPAAAADEALDEMHAAAAVDPDKKWDGDRLTLFVCPAEPYAATDELLVAVAMAAAVWNEAGAGPWLDVAGTDACDDDVAAADGVNRVGFQRDSWRWPETAGAATTTWRRSASSIHDADVALNPVVDWSMNAGAHRTSYDLWNVLTHELGHVLGLPDIKDPDDATMFFMARRGETGKRSLADEDLSMLLQLYHQVDADAASCAHAPVAPWFAALLSCLLPRWRRR